MNDEISSSGTETNFDSPDVDQQASPAQNSDIADIRLRKITTDGVLVCIGIAIPLIAWFYIPFGGESHWFARSGAIMAIVGIMLESRLFISKIMIYELAGLRGNTRAPSGYRFAMSKLMAMLSHTILISGAIISGYGDLIFAAVKFGNTP
jgi:hypothetical protein